MAFDKKQYDEQYQKVVTEILTQAFPLTGSSVNDWDVDVQSGGESGGGGGGFGGL